MLSLIWHITSLDFLIDKELKNRFSYKNKNVALKILSLLVVMKSGENKQNRPPIFYNCTFCTACTYKRFEAQF